MANRTFVLSDLHGHYNILLEMLKKIQFSDDDELYILGDCNDRGISSMKIYEFLAQHKDNIHLLKGNHELMMRDAFKSNSKSSPQWRLWKDNGGEKTLDSYKDYIVSDDMSEEEAEAAWNAFYQRMIDLVDSCPSYVEKDINDKHFVLVHAGFNPEKELIEQNEEECAWMREWFYMSPGMKDKLIIFGHTPTCYLNTSSSNFDIWRDPIFDDKIGIDGGLGPFDKGQLNCLCLNDMSVQIIRKIDIEDD